MPIATIELEDKKKFELKTLPGAYVELRVMPYGQWLKRQELALNLKIEMTKGKKESTGEMAMANAEVTLFEYKNSVVDHNLTDASENKLDFTNLATFQLLHPKIGNEIASYITELHEFMSEEEQGN